ncbi:MAG: efflux RND transporter periplasmic adaptor subunit [Muribaculaceae bacterium]|nr:efflux RND transporter periplasmic adaptor subunit [Muribaculaceae bacterium]
MKYINFIAIGAALMALLVPVACSSDKATADTTAEEIPAVKVSTAEERDVDQTVTLTATVEPQNINNISAMTPNRIKQILVDEGMRVSAGQRLVVLDDVNTTSYRLQVDNARASLQNVQRDYDRAVELLNIGGGTQQQVDQMHTQLVNARNALSAAERTLRNATENTVLTSPVSGVVTARNYDPGDMTGALPILTIAQIQPVKTVVNISESDLSRVHKGMPASVTFDTYGDEVFHGTVTMVMPSVDPQSHTFAAEITIPNPDSRLLPGMFGRVMLSLGHARHVVVPDLAVVKQTGSGNHYVYVLHGDSVSYDRVELGRRLGDAYELLSGVEPGATVVVSGQSKLHDGAHVRVQK